jgi:ferritin-like metal-binding protein YciE
MTEKEILKFGEIQYLKGRLDELYKALPTVTNLERQRKLDQRIEKYIQKLKNVDEVAYHLYEVEKFTTTKVKEKGKKEIKDLLEQILINENIMNEDILERIKKQIEKY